VLNKTLPAEKTIFGGNPERVEQVLRTLLRRSPSLSKILAFSRIGSTSTPDICSEIIG
jgi:hypothetical protein